MNILITGGCGFIGTNLVNFLLEGNKVDKIVVIDKLTSVANTHVPFLDTIDERVEFLCDDINNMMDYEFVTLGEPNVVINLAAESHVDRSIEDASKFFDTNVKGTYQVAKWCAINNVKMIHFSTDEIYGQIDEEDGNIRFVEDFDSPKPRNPYSCTKLFA